jgi:hypothetical protein
MAKRFTDNALWEKEWFQDLPAAEKLAWFFIKDRCDAAGVWSPNRRMAEFVIGEKIDWEGFMGRCNGNIEVLPDGKWYLVDFVMFQNGQLRESCPPHRAVLALLEKHGLAERVLKGYRKGIDTLEDKDKEKDQEQDKDLPRAKKKSDLPDIPADLAAIPGLPAAWADWQQHRREIHKALTPKAAEGQFVKLRESPDPVAMIRHSIASQYQGLYEPKSGAPQRAPGKADTDGLPRFGR